MKVRSVLVTGGCGDIGRAIAVEFAHRGDHVALCDLLSESDAAPHLETVKAAGGRVFYRQVDVSDAPAVASFVRDAASEFGGLDICIGNAGIVERGPLVDLSLGAWNRQMSVNLTGCFLTAQAAAREMKQRSGGHIVLISSWTQDVPWENIGAYCVSKSGLKMLAKCLALELAPVNIRVNLVAPGFVDAGLTGENLRRDPARRPVMQQSVPLGRLTTAEEVAGTVMLLCSEQAGYITGATLLVDGGRSLNFGKA